MEVKACLLEGIASQASKPNITLYLKYLITAKCSKCSLALLCITTDDVGRNGPQSYRPGDALRGEMGKGKSGRHPDSNRTSPIQQRHKVRAVRKETLVASLRTAHVTARTGFHLPHC